MFWKKNQLKLAPDPTPEPALVGNGFKRSVQVLAAVKLKRSTLNKVCEPTDPPSFHKKPVGLEVTAAQMKLLCCWTLWGSASHVSFYFMSEFNSYFISSVKLISPLPCRFWSAGWTPCPPDTGSPPQEAGCHTWLRWSGLCWCCPLSPYGQWFLHADI